MPPVRWLVGTRRAMTFRPHRGHGLRMVTRPGGASPSRVNSPHTHSARTGTPAREPIIGTVSFQAMPPEERSEARRHLAVLADRVAAARDHYEDELAVRDAAIVRYVESGIPAYLIADWAKVSQRQARRALAKI